MAEKSKLLDQVDKDYREGKITEEEYAAFLVEMFEGVAPTASKPSPVDRPSETSCKELEAALDHVFKGTTAVHIGDQVVLTRAWMPLPQVLENIDRIARIDKTITQDFLNEVKKIVICAFVTDPEELKKIQALK